MDVPSVSGALECRERGPSRRQTGSTVEAHPSPGPDTDGVGPTPVPERTAPTTRLHPPSPHLLLSVHRVPDSGVTRPRAHWPGVATAKDPIVSPVPLRYLSLHRRERRTSRA